MEYWVDGVLKHSLYNEVLISLGKRQIGKFVDAPWKYTVEVSDATNSAPLDDRDVSAIYDATGLLLILGDPGSGKTTTLLHLARTLLERAEEDIKELYAATVTQMAQAGLPRTRRQRRSRAFPLERLLPERMNQAR
jgi:DNA polymerase III delta prime subunit